MAALALVIDGVFQIFWMSKYEGELKSNMLYARSLAEPLLEEDGAKVIVLALVIVGKVHTDLRTRSRKREASSRSPLSMMKSRGTRSSASSVQVQRVGAYSHLPRTWEKARWWIPSERKRSRVSSRDLRKEREDALQTGGARELRCQNGAIEREMTGRTKRLSLDVQ